MEWFKISLEEELLIQILKPPFGPTGLVSRPNVPEMVYVQVLLDLLTDPGGRAQRKIA